MDTPRILVRMSKYLDIVHDKIVVFDGAMGSNLQTLDLTADDFGGETLEGCNEALILHSPESVAKIHESFLAVGCDVIETNTFGAFSVVLAEYGIQAQTYEINKKAAELAVDMAKSYSTPDKPRFVAGSIGPGTKLPSLGQITFDQLVTAYEEQCQGLIDGGVDLFLFETMFDLLTAKAGITAARRVMARSGRVLPIQVQVTMELTGRMLPGTEISAAYTALEAMHPDVIGINCATGPKEMAEHLRYLSASSEIPISCLPNAGLPSIVDGKMHYDLTPKELADYHKRYITEYGISVVGGCCGTTPEHLKAVIEAIDNLEPKIRSVNKEPALASLYSAVPLHQDLAYLAVGERTNANGSKRFREAMLNEDWDTCVDMAQEQVKDGAHVIDLCVDYTGSNGVEIMGILAKRLATQSTLPIMIDSTEADVVETALKYLGGRAAINSVNLEEGSEAGTRLDKFLNLAQQYGAAVVCTCIDENGQARTAQWKVDAATAIAELATTRYGLKYADLIFDPLVLPISTGMEESRKDGIETIEGIRLIKERYPDSFTIIGLSNISFGLNPRAREALNSIFLDECRKAGLDAAIAHPSKIIPLHRIPKDVLDVCLDLIYDRRTESYDPLQKLIEIFNDPSQNTAVDAVTLESLPIEERLHKRIVDGNRKGLEDDLLEAFNAGYKPLDIINNFLLEGMKEVGDLFGSGKMQLPFVLSSAETMKTAVSFLEPHMEVTDSANKGRIVLATVKGDVHDIGKNLVDIILTNNGYEVRNLGIKVSISEMISAAKESQADAIGMSGLLVKSTLIMKENLEELEAQNLSHLPVILGGAALTRTYVERDLRSLYSGRLFYGKDAFEGLEVMNKLIDIKYGKLEDSEFGRKISEKKVFRQIRSEREPSEGPVSIQRSPQVEVDNDIFTPPFIGTKVVKGISLDDIAQYVNETALYRHQWGYRPQNGESDSEFKSRIRGIFREELNIAKKEQLLVPMVVYGYFPAASSGNDLIVYEDETKKKILTTFTFPRQQKEPYLCIADFFRPIKSPDVDFVAFHVVTMGTKVSEAARYLFDKNKYQDYLHLHGLGVEMAEALAEYWHRRIREEWGFADEDGPTLSGLFKQQYRGGRYSWGYPACPNLEDNAKVVDLLDAKRIHVEVSDEFQLHPEQTTTAIVCHHPKSKYFIA